MFYMVQNIENTFQCLCGQINCPSSSCVRHLDENQERKLTLETPTKKKKNTQGNTTLWCVQSIVNKQCTPQWNLS